jgi:hypothetical protein
MMVCQIIYNIVLCSNEFTAVSERKERINTESTEERDTEIAEIRRGCVTKTSMRHAAAVCQAVPTSRQTKAIGVSAGGVDRIKS